MQTDLNYLKQLVDQKSKIKDLTLFHKSVNIIFHDIEANYYDKLHKEMWDSLQPVYNSLIDSLDLQKLRKLKVLDIGCGTGLSAKMLTNTSLKNEIKKIVLLDTSSVMLEKSKYRFSKNPIEIDFFEGDIFDLKDNDFDLILVSSVLHHIPDLEFFFIEINKKLKLGGLLFHIHDPNGDAIRNKIYLDRKQVLEAYFKIYNKKSSVRVINKVKNLLLNTNELNYIVEVNNNLLKNNIIHTSLTPQEIWSVTDIHVEDLPYSTNNGISVNGLTKLLYNFKLKVVKSYSFFGIMPSKLPPKYALLEKDLFNANDLNGRNISCIWEKIY